MAQINMIHKDILAFFNSLSERKFSEAERMITTIEQSLKFTMIDGSGKRKRAMSNKRKTETLDHIAGYIVALEGILAAVRTGDERPFFNRMPSDLESLELIKRDFSSFTKNKIFPFFDKGFFSAWSDYIIYLQNHQN